MAKASVDDSQVPFVDMQVVNAPYVADLRNAFERVLQSGVFAGGQEVQDFETELAQYVGCAYAVAVNSGTSALQLALLAAGIGDGDEVILPANTFFATMEAVIATGAKPVLVDCCKDTALIDFEAVESAVSQRTAGLLPVHLYGQPVDMSRARLVADRHKLFLLEDAAQALGGAWAGEMVGSMGGAGAISFYPGKNLGALGEGGAIVTQDADIAVLARKLREHGSMQKYIHDMWGFNERMDALQAAFLRVKLKKFDVAQSIRLQAVERYVEGLQANANVELLVVDARARHTHHLLVIRVHERDRIMRELHLKGVQAAVHYPVPLHLTAAAAGEFGERGSFPNAELLADEVLSLPLFAGINQAQIDYVLEVLLGTVRVRC